MRLNIIIYLLFGLSFKIHNSPVIRQAPPGTSRINDTLFLDNKLVTIEVYQEFLNSLQSEAKLLGLDYIRCLPDSNIEYLRKPYLQTNLYKKNYPIVNLSQYQISSFCIWRSWAVNLMKNNPSRRCDHKYWDLFDIDDPKRVSEVIYFIPDSITVNILKPLKQIKVLEKFSNENNSLIDLVQKKFNRNEIFGFRCAAKYIPRK